MSTKRKTYRTFKAKGALEAYKGDKTAAEIICVHKVSSGQVSTWKKCLIEGAAQLFESSSQVKAIDGDVLTVPLYE